MGFKVIILLRPRVNFTIFCSFLCHESPLDCYGIGNVFITCVFRMSICVNNKRIRGAWLGGLIVGCIIIITIIVIMIVIIVIIITIIVITLFL